MKVAWERADEAIATLSELLKEERALPLLQTVERRMRIIRGR
jgi:hypothetical protein